MAADLTKYPQEKHVLFIVYDPAHQIRDTTVFIRVDAQSVCSDSAVLRAYAKLTGRFFSRTSAGRGYTLLVALLAFPQVTDIFRQRGAVMRYDQIPPDENFDWPRCEHNTLHSPTLRYAFACSLQANEHPKPRYTVQRIADSRSGVTDRNSLLVL